MYRFKSDSLKALTKIIFLSLGASDEEAEIVSEHLIENNLMGFDSHGIIRVLQYALEAKEQKYLKLNATPEILKQAGSIALIDAKLQLGPAASAKATEKAIELAEKYGIGSVAIKNIHHVGRLGAYTSLAAKNNMIGFACVNFATKLAMSVAPFGGKVGRISTNPISFACPINKDYPFLVDISTSTVAEGKVRVAKYRNEKIPYGWILNKFGQTSNNPNDLYDGGALLPLGGLMLGHKGFALGLIVEILGGALSGNKTAQRGIKQRGQGVFILVINIEKYLPLNEFKQELGNLFLHLKNTPTLNGFGSIFIPGEIEYIKRLKNLKEGILLESKTWNEISKLAKNLKININKLAVPIN